ncbi:hypothetical protein Hokovirus_3_258 [Hokovirus HKV1]|uniref:Uncharacterized protein n=1 Tax=Hokovirus HKV1 TaxID=1977638 RepID=A0A1V0SGY5_9VIRU|nr:hypothetical protein Hokovirus_3_258 [Hokovirus HKV1]
MSLSINTFKDNIKKRDDSLNSRKKAALDAFKAAIREDKNKDKQQNLNNIKRNLENFQHQCLNLEKNKNQDNLYPLIMKDCEKYMAKYFKKKFDILADEKIKAIESDKNNCFKPDYYPFAQKICDKWTTDSIKKMQATEKTENKALKTQIKSSKKAAETSSSIEAQKNKQKELEKNYKQTCIGSNKDKPQCVQWKKDIDKLKANVENKGDKNLDVMAKCINFTIRSEVRGFWGEYNDQDKKYMIDLAKDTINNFLNKNIQVPKDYISNQINKIRKGSITKIIGNIKSAVDENNFLEATHITLNNYIYIVAYYCLFSTNFDKKQSEAKFNNLTGSYHLLNTRYISKYFNVKEFEKIVNAAQINGKYDKNKCSNVKEDILNLKVIFAPEMKNIVVLLDDYLKTQK